MKRHDPMLSRTGLVAHRGWPGLLIGAGVAAVFMTGLVTCQLWPYRQPAKPAHGTVLALEAVVRKHSSGLIAHVATPDGRTMVSLPTGTSCRPGDRIDLWKRGDLYGAGPGGCSRE